MATKIKGICKGSFKYISQIFVVKEREMEIGYPTDVKHVAHIGWDGADGTAPIWMNEFKTGSDMVVASVGSSLGGSRNTTWTSQDFEQSFGRQSSSSTMLNNFPPTNLPSIPKKHKRKKVKSTTSSPKSSSARSSRSSKSKSISMMGESEESSSRHSIKL